MKKVLMLLIAVIVNCVGSLAYAQPKNQSEPLLMRLLPEVGNTVNLRVPAERIKGIGVMMAFVLKQYPPPPEPEQAIINYYQAKHDFATTAILQPEGTKLYLELLEDSRALGILHYHLRNRLDATAKCIDSLIPSIGNRNEVVCYMRIWSALVSAHENAISRSESSKSSDDRQIASSEAIRLAAAENLMMGLIAGATGFDREFMSGHYCRTDQEFKKYSNKCEKRRPQDGTAGR
jgi:hypothetical protein